MEFKINLIFLENNNKVRNIKFQLDSFLNSQYEKRGKIQ